jgi:beta-glucosidase
LKNDGLLLPLERDTIESIAVIGPLADRVLVDWYSGTPPYTVSPVEGIRKKVGGRVAVRAVTNNDESDAVRAALESEVCVVCVGNHPTGDSGWADVTRPSYGKEAVDRKSLDLEDESLVRRVWEANPRTIVVLVSSFPYAIVWTQEKVPAILHVTHNSQELGTAVADVLFGDHNPAGRLVQTWPRSAEQLPPMMDYDIRRGRTYMYLEGEPLYPFGHGLSYTTFAYSGLRTSADCIRGDGLVSGDRVDREGRLVVELEVENTGERAGDEVVQLYVRFAGPRGEGPRLALRGFRRIHLDPGGMATVAMELEAKDFRRWDAIRRSFGVLRGEMEVMIGRSSAAIEMRTMIHVV